MTDNSKKIRMNGQFLWQLGFEEPLEAHDKVYGFKRGSSGLQSASLVEIDNMVDDQKGQPNGIAPLNNEAKINSQYLSFDPDQLKEDVIDLQSGLTSETSNREQADILLQQQIDAITGGSDVHDVVGTYQELEDYDTSTLSNNDIVKVLNDNTHNNAITYYRWVITEGTGAWTYLGSLGPFFTKAESLSTFVPQTRTINGIPLTEDITIETGSISPRFSINSGNTDNQGNMDILDNSTSNILAFKVDDGTTYKPLLATDGYIGEQFTKTSLDSISMNAENVSADTYNVFCPKNGNTPYLLNNTIFVQPQKPSDEPIDTIPKMTSNTSPYGTVTTSLPSGGAAITDPWKVFRQGITSSNDSANLNYGYVSKIITYTYDENYQPLSGLYNVKYTPASTNASTACTVRGIKIYFSDNTYVNWENIGGSSTTPQTTEWSRTFNAPSSIVKVELTLYNGIVGALQILEPAILDEGTIWVNNGVEPLEVMTRDENAQWQPFYDVLMGTCTVNDSKTITAVTNQGFNYFSTVNMHNISLTAHEDIRNEIPKYLYDLVDTSSSTPIKQADTLTGLTASIAELNYSDGLTGNIQEQINVISENYIPEIKAWETLSSPNVILYKNKPAYMYMPVADTTFTFDITNLNLSVGEYFEFKFIVPLMAGVHNLTFPNSLMWLNNIVPSFSSQGIYLIEIMALKNPDGILLVGKV